MKDITEDAWYSHSRKFKTNVSHYEFREIWQAAAAARDEEIKRLQDIIHDYLTHEEIANIPVQVAKPTIALAEVQSESIGRTGGANPPTGVNKLKCNAQSTNIDKTYVQKEGENEPRDIQSQLSAAQAMNDKLVEALTAWQETRTRCCNEGGIENLGRLANAEHDLVKALTAYEQEK